jgi:hypothetical protein
MSGAGESSPKHEPFWPVGLAFLAIALLSYALPEHLSPGPSWLLPVIVATLLAPWFYTEFRGSMAAHRLIGHLTLGVVTVGTGFSLVRMVLTLPGHKATPVELLKAAGCLWLSNVLVFASWYWRLDAGGPIHRSKRPRHNDGAFLFPQMTLNEKDWHPGFIDYLFLAFNTSTAFSPTDVPVLDRWAKVLMMVQATISLGTLALLAARAVNVL